MYYDIVNSGERIKELRAARRMTRQQLAEQIGLSVDALRKIEAGVNGAKIDTLISIAELFHITLDYLVCGCERKAEVDDLLVGLKEAVNCFKSFSSFNPSPEYQKTKSADYQKSNQHLVIYLLTVFMQPLL